MKDTLLTTIQQSKKELQNVTSLCIASLMSAFGTLLGLFFRIPIIPKMLYISFSYLALAINGYLCGPYVGAIVGGITDILKHFMKPDGDFFIGFTLNEILMGFVLGLLFYHRKHISIKLCFFASLFNAVVLNTLLTPLWLYIMYGNALLPIIGTRLIKNILLLPIETFLLYLVLTSISKIKPYRK